MVIKMNSDDRESRRRSGRLRNKERVNMAEPDSEDEAVEREDDIEGDYDKPKKKQKKSPEIDTDEKVSESSSNTSSSERLLTGFREIRSAADLNTHPVIQLKEVNFPSNATVIKKSGGRLMKVTLSATDKQSLPEEFIQWYTFVRNVEAVFEKKCDILAIKMTGLSCVRIIEVYDIVSSIELPRVTYDKQELLAVLMYLHIGGPLDNFTKALRVTMEDLVEILKTFVITLYHKFTIGYSSKNFRCSKKKTFDNIHQRTQMYMDIHSVVCVKPPVLIREHYKFLVARKLNGQCVFVSGLYDYNIPDKAIYAQSNVSEKFQPESLVIADRGQTLRDTKLFETEVDFTELYSNPSKLNLLAIKECVDQSIERMNQFQALRKEIPHQLVSVSSQLINSCVFLSNFNMPEFDYLSSEDFELVGPDSAS